MWVSTLKDRANKEVFYHQFAPAPGSYAKVGRIRLVMFGREEYA